MNPPLNPDRENFEEIACWVEKVSEESTNKAHAQCAEILESTYYATRDQPESKQNYYQQLDRLVALLSSLDECHPLRLPSRGEVLGKRQPSFLESVLATKERLQVTEKLAEALGAVCDAIIVGGSVGYGPFYNVRRNIDGLDGSDVDMVAIADEEKFSSPELWNLLEGVELSERVAVFGSLLHDQRANLISQRFALDGIMISLHIFPQEEFRKLLVGKRTKTDFQGTSDAEVTVLDYKAFPFEHQFSVQRNFSGQRHFHEVGPQESVPKGFVTKLPSYSILNSELFPGVLHNLISPKFEIYKASSREITDIVKEFEDLIRQRYAKESKIKPSSRFLASHTRFELFSPLVIERYS